MTINNLLTMTESILTPWSVKGKVDYMAQIQKFGTSPIDEKLIERWEQVTKTKAHHCIRRGLVFSHQDLHKILDCVEKHIPVYIYTGRGPSGESMHLGHLVPFRLTRYLQQALKCIVIIQMSDDEKFFFKDGVTANDLKKYNDYCYKNALDIIACGFDVNKTLFFSNLEQNNPDLYFNSTLLMKSCNMTSIKSIYGIGEILPQSVINVINNEIEIEKNKENPDNHKLSELQSTIKKFSMSGSNNIGQCVWPVFQSSPAFCTSFRKLFINSITHHIKHDNITTEKFILMQKILTELNDVNSEQSIMCLVPMAIDQSPYFRMARDMAHILKCPKPAVIHSEFLPSLQSESKMSTTDNNNATIFLDIDVKKLPKMINKYAFSGGQDTLENHRKYGGNIKIDICYQYLTFFLEDDQKLNEIAQAYTSGIMTSGEIKKITSDIIVSEILKHQEIKKNITDDILHQFFDHRRILNIE